MTSAFLRLCIMLATLLMLPVSPSLLAAGQIRVLVVTGGHGFDRPEFFRMFEQNPDISFEAVEHPKAHEALRPEAAARYDVIALYDMWQPIAEEARSNFVARLQEGKGLVVLHHALASYQQWPEYERIIGGKYVLPPPQGSTNRHAASTYQHDLDFRVRIADATHPVTRGVMDFDIHDETYGGFVVAADVHKLLTTDHPTSTPTIGWAKTYSNARVVYLQLGHDKHAFAHPQYRRLLAQAIRWTAKRD